MLNKNNEQDLPEECPHCKSTEILCDYFEDEWMYWCSACGHDITKEEEYDYEKDKQDDAISRAARILGTDKVPSVGGDKV